MFSTAFRYIGILSATYLFLLSPCLASEQKVQEFSYASLRQSNWEQTKYIETDNCFVSFLEKGKNKIVVKQIKDATPDEQFLLVMDAFGCHIAQTANISINAVSLIPAYAPFPGKTRTELPATIHTMAQGISTDQESHYQGIDVHQRYRKKDSEMWRRWGPLPLEKSGLTRTVISSMAQHIDLPPIVALDTFIGNADRSLPNLFYDPTENRFCGIDLAAACCSPLAAIACKQLKSIRKESLTPEERTALLRYAHTLKFLIKKWPPEKQEELLLEYGRTAGFFESSPLWDQNVSERIQFHIATIKDNFQYAKVVVERIHDIFSEPA